MASYISLKKNNKVKNLKEWLKKIFDIKHNIWTYILVILFVLIYYVLGCAINGFKFGAPIFMLIVILPMMLFGGGNEEVGWRMILQPELEKKFGFHIATTHIGRLGEVRTGNNVKQNLDDQIEQKENKAISKIEKLKEDLKQALLKNTQKQSLSMK